MPDDESSSSSGEPSPSCGDGNVDDGEECDDGNAVGTDDCTTLCTLAICGDGIVWDRQEACDDANDVDTDECIGDCVEASCGDGFIYVGVEDCDDANEATGDGCAADCAAENAHIYLMVRTDPDTLHRYSVDDDSWESIPTGQYVSNVASSGITTDGEGIYWAELENSSYLYRFDLATSTLQELDPPPDMSWEDDDSQSVLWLDGRLYVVATTWALHPRSVGTNVYVLDNGEWSTFSVDLEADEQIAVDPVNREMYVPRALDLGFFVIDGTTHDVVREFETGTIAVHGPGAYLAGSFYTQSVAYADEPLMRLDGLDGTQEDTGFTPTSFGSSAVPNPATHKIYFAGWFEEVDHFEVYDTLDGTSTTLASPPISDDSQEVSSVVLVYPND